MGALPLKRTGDGQRRGRDESMKSQRHEGWFPECLVCGRGDVGAIVCLDPACHEAHLGEIVGARRQRLIQRDGHWWKLCRFCSRPVLSDPGAWGSYALCTDCWNRLARARIAPPAFPRPAGDAHRRLPHGEWPRGRHKVGPGRRARRSSQRRLLEPRQSRVRGPSEAVTRRSKPATSRETITGPV
jgi:hypothetical protein